MADRCTLRFRVSGANPSKASRQSLTLALEESLRHCELVTALPIVQGIELILEFSDIEPFDRESFEPYVLDQILIPTAQSHCSGTEAALGFQLLSQRFT